MACGAPIRALHGRIRWCRQAMTGARASGPLRVRVMAEKA
jgi:hypothetical protein